MAELVQAIFLEVDGVRCATTITKIDTEENWQREAVKTINRQRRALFDRNGIPEFPLSFEAVIKRGAQDEVDWEKLGKDGKEVSVVVEKDDGKRKSYRRFVVQSNKESSDADGNVTRSISGYAKDVVIS